MKVLAFGDSFVKMFIHCEPDVKHWKFKGKSIRGLIKYEDLERKKIQQQIRRAPQGTRILFFFGQVDFNYVRYYKALKGDAPLKQDTFQKYVEWISSLNTRKNISIVSIFPSPIRRDYIIPGLVSKGSYSNEQQTQALNETILKQYDRSVQTWEQWNRWIAQNCAKYKVDNIQLFKSATLDPQFYDISNLTIHLRYIPVLKLVTKYVDITFDAEKAQQIQRMYEVEKVERISNSISLTKANSIGEFGIQKQSENVRGKTVEDGNQSGVVLVQMKSMGGEGKDREEDGENLKGTLGNLKEESQNSKLNEDETQVQQEQEKEREQEVFEGEGNVQPEKKKKKRKKKTNWNQPTNTIVKPKTKAEKKKKQQQEVSQKSQDSEQESAAIFLKMSCKLRKK